MTLVLELAAELERAWPGGRRVLAAAGGNTVCVLAAGVSVNAAPQSASGAVLVAYWRAEGLVGKWPDIADPADHSHALRHRTRRSGLAVEG